MQINAQGQHFADLNNSIRHCAQQDIELTNVLGQRYIGSGTGDKVITIHGTPGNALGAYLNGSTVHVYGNAQDATGDTMNKGEIIIHGSSGDASGYAMRGGRMLIRGDAGYRAGIHMKAYEQAQPVIVIGGRTGSFLGEYQAGGTIIVLGLDAQDCPVGPFCGTGMHGGHIFIRAHRLRDDLPPQVRAELAPQEELAAIEPHIQAFCDAFGIERSRIGDTPFYMLSPNSDNPYKQLYTHN